MAFPSNVLRLTVFRNLVPTSRPSILARCLIPPPPLFTFFPKPSLDDASPKNHIVPPGLCSRRRVFFRKSPPPFQCLPSPPVPFDFFLFGTGTEHGRERSPAPLSAATAFFRNTHNSASLVPNWRGLLQSQFMIVFQKVRLLPFQYGAKFLRG